MSYYRVCPYCGCHLDPCEVCDCKETKSRCQCGNTNNGKVESGIDSHFSTSYINKNIGGNQDAKI